MREENSVSEEEVAPIFKQLKTEFSKDWLLSLELYEVALQNSLSIQTEIQAYLIVLQQNKQYKKLIENGLNLLAKTKP